MSNLINEFIRLRKFYFLRHVKRYAHERDWEDEDRSERREIENERLEKEFNQETQDIINGTTEKSKFY